MKEFFKLDLSDPHNYDMVINDSEFSVENSARIIIQAMRYRGLLDRE